MFIYAKNAGYTESAIGRLETPIKMLIEHESDAIKKNGGTRDWLFNVEKSSRFGESIIYQDSFNTFQYVMEGNGAERDTVREIFSKFIEHVQFMKEFCITAEMMEDARFGIAADAKRRIQSFTRAYYHTLNKACELALAGGTEERVQFAGANLDLTTADGYPLFYDIHEYGINYDVQSNNFWGDLCKTTNSSGVRDYSMSRLEEALYTLAVRLRNMKDENGDPLGYTADTIILPGNRPILESMIKRVCGSENATGSSNNDINLHYGNWSIVVLPNWVSEADTMLVMSSEANKNLAGNMFFERVPLTISNWVDHHTGNYMWNGRCRFGIGFGTYKHIVRMTDTEDEIEHATELD